MMPPFPILILAAGQSARMRGADKLAERVDGIPLLRAQAQKALEVSDLVFVALRGRNHPRTAYLTDLPVILLAVPDAIEGMSGTLRGAVAQLPDCTYFMVLLADLPELTGDDLQTVVTSVNTHPNNLIWRGATADGAPGHPIVFAASLRPEFALLAGDGGGEPVVRPHKDQTHLVSLPNQHARRDLDTPEEWAAWRAETGR